MTTDFAHWDALADDRYQIAAICDVTYRTVKLWASSGVVPARSARALALYFGEVNQAEWEDHVENERQEIAHRERSRTGEPRESCATGGSV